MTNTLAEIIGSSLGSSFTSNKVSPAKHCHNGNVLQDKDLVHTPTWEHLALKTLVPQIIKLLPLQADCYGQRSHLEHM